MDEPKTLSEAVDDLRGELLRLRDAVAGWAWRHPWVIWLACAYVLACVVAGFAYTFGVVS